MTHGFHSYEVLGVNSHYVHVHCWRMYARIVLLLALACMLEGVSLTVVARQGVKLVATGKCP